MRLTDPKGVTLVKFLSKFFLRLSFSAGKASVLRPTLLKCTHSTFSCENSFFIPKTIFLTFRTVTSRTCFHHVVDIPRHVKAAPRFPKLLRIFMNHQQLFNEVEVNWSGYLPGRYRNHTKNLFLSKYQKKCRKANSWHKFVFKSVNLFA